MTAKPIPDGYHSVTPYLIVKGAADAMEFYKKAFNACEVMRLEGPDGKVGHAEIQIGDSRVMLAEEHPQMKALAPRSPGSSGVAICLYVENVDEVVSQATRAGAKIQRPLQNQFYGDRSATLEDPFGHVWTVATHIEDVPPEEIKRRMEEMMKRPGASQPTP
jgi:PhnB protein